MHHFFKIALEILAVWALAGGIIPAVLVAHSIFGTAKYKRSTKIATGLLLGPQTWAVLLFAGAAATLMAFIHGRRVKKA